LEQSAGARLGAVAGLHPVAAWTLRQIARERELACDDWVVSRIGEARPYAASLARLFEVCRSAAPRGPGYRDGRERVAPGRAHRDAARQRPSLQRAHSLLRVGFAAIALSRWWQPARRRPIGWCWRNRARARPRRRSAATHRKPVNPHGSFLAALVAAGYGDLSVDEIIALKDHGIDARFLADLSQSGWEKMSAHDMIEMHDHGVTGELLRALHDAGFQHIQMRDVIQAFEQGVRPGTLKEAAQYGTHLTLAQIVKLKQAGVIQ
jgi:hypothetical protein